MPVSADGSQPSRKRRRSREPDWNAFYKNGLPKEIIVIDDDSPEPGIPAAGNGTGPPDSRPVAAAGAATGAIPTVHEVDGRPPAKKRKKDDETTSVHYDPVHHSFTVNSQTGTPSCHGTKSRVASDGSVSSVKTTAAPSLG